MAANAVAETMLQGIDDLWCQIEDGNDTNAAARDNARLAVVTARVRMTDVARGDIGV